MSFINQNGAVKSAFKIADLGTDFKKDSIKGCVNAIKSILSRPIDGLNVIGTGSGVDGVQFYGWGSPVAAHTDDTGYIFFMPIHMDSEDWLISGNEKIKLELGSVYALNDAVLHSTQGNGHVVAASIGSVTEDYIKNNPGYLETVVKEFKKACFA